MATKFDNGMVWDPTGWMIGNSVSDFLTVHSAEIRYLCIFGYTLFHGHRVFGALKLDDAPSFKFVNLLMACFGGGILVPIFLNMYPVPLANDALPIGVIVSFTIHSFFPALRDIINQSDIIKGLLVVLFETFRAMVVVNFTTAAAGKIPPSFFSFPLFGPIICGTIAGCGGAFLPFNKGLEPIKKGLAPPMITAAMAATTVNLFLSTPLSDGCIEAEKKARACVATFFITVGLVNALSHFQAPKSEALKKKAD